MSERFKQLAPLNINYYEPNVPVEIDKGIILLDATTNQTLLQLKLRNISNQMINFVELEVECFDLTGAPVSENHIVPFIYQDFEVSPKEFFGDRQAIQLAGEKTRQVNIIFKKIMFKDGAVETFDKIERFEIPQTKSIDTLSMDLRKEIDSLNLLSKYAKINNLPKEISDNEWVCCCGRVNTNNESCVRCGRDKDYQLENLTIDNLKQLAENSKELKKDYEKFEGEKESEQQLSSPQSSSKVMEEKINKYKDKNNLNKVIKFGLIIFLLLIVVLSGKVLLPKIFISPADLISEGNYKQAYKIASADEKENIYAENLIAVLSAESVEFLKDPSSFVLRNAWYAESSKEVVMQVSGKNGFGGTTTSYWYYTYSEEDKEYQLFTSVSSLKDEELSKYDSSDKKLEKTLNNIARISINAIVSKDEYELSKESIQNINDLFEEGVLDSVELIEKEY